MSIEQLLERIAVSLETIAKGNTNHATTKPAPVTSNAVQETVHKPEPVAPVTQVAAAPAFVPPVAAPVEAPVQSCPITDQKSLVAYVMSSYQALGPEKGGRIQEVLGSMGAQHLNDIKPDNYSALYQAIETLKGA
jgi:hypothetical protein